MKFLSIISRTHKKSISDYDAVELKRIKFEAPSIQAGKTRATKIANAQVLLENIVQSDDTIGNITGAELRWEKWDVRDSYEKNGKHIGWSGKKSEHYYGNFDPQLHTSPVYFSWVTLYWGLAK